MCQQFHIQGSIAAMRDAVPIRFVHRKSTDCPENHTLHINNYLEIYVYIAGNHQYIVENRLYDLQKGDMILINPREVHKALPLGECNYERFYLLLDVHCFDGLVHNPLTHILNPPTGTGNLISPDPDTRAQVLQLLYTLSGCFQNGQDAQLKALGCVLQLLDICKHHLTPNRSAAGSAAPVPALLEQILTYVTDNTATLQTTGQIAHALGMTPQYLSAYFSKHIGTPLKVYMQAKKIALAKDLLDRGADVTDACYACGFNDCSYFIRVFKKYVGTTPLRYKQQLFKG